MSRDEKSVSMTQGRTGFTHQAAGAFSHKVCLCKNAKCGNC